MESQLLLTPADVAVRLSIGRTVVYELMANGELESLKIGRSRRILSSAVEAYVERLRERAQAAIEMSGDQVQ
jgi:excisionase family DNA binding protein